MPKIKKTRTRPAPDGWEEIEPTIMDIQRKLREAETESHEGKRKTESLWPVMRLHHQRSRYIYDLYYKRHVISKELYDWCVKEKYADAALIAKWRKVGKRRFQRGFEETEIVLDYRCRDTERTLFALQFYEATLEQLDLLLFSSSDSSLLPTSI